MTDSTGNGAGTGPEGSGERWPESGAGSTPVIATAEREAAPRRIFAGVGFLLDATRRRRGGRIALWAVVVGLALSGIGLLSYPFVTDIWADRIQNGLEVQFSENVPAQVQAYRSRSVKTGSALTRLKIPSLNVNTIVVEGITGNALRAGAGHYPQTALPGDATGNVAIAGHRTGFGEPFRHLDRLREGDMIELSTPVGRFEYRVIGPFDGHANPWVTHADDWSVVSGTVEPSLTLTTCDPPGTSKNRLIVRAVLVQSHPA